jgi:hypothetical protein
MVSQKAGKWCTCYYSNTGYLYYQPDIKLPAENSSLRIFCKRMGFVVYLNRNDHPIILGQEQEQRLYEELRQYHESGQNDAESIGPNSG